MGLTPTAQVPVVPMQRGNDACPQYIEDTSASSAEEETRPTIRPFPTIDQLDMRSRLRLELYRQNQRNRNKLLYVEFGITDVVNISDEDKEEVKMYEMMRGVPEGLVEVKKEAMTVAELDEKLKKRMNDEIA